MDPKIIRIPWTPWKKYCVVTKSFTNQRGITYQPASPMQDNSRMPRAFVCHDAIKHMDEEQLHGYLTTRNQNTIKLAQQTTEVLDRWNKRMKEHNKWKKNCEES